MKKTLFDSLHGSWRLFRTIKSSIPTYPSGTLAGTANLERRNVQLAPFSAEYLYTEAGEFTTDRSLSMKARRQYAYRYQDDLDKITVWFVKADELSEVDYLFHALSFSHDTDGSSDIATTAEDEVLLANGYHLCVNDNYTAQYKFTLVGHEVTEWSLRFVVKGPDKDYITDSHFTR